MDKYDSYESEWLIMRRWLGKYILEESAIHHVRYVLPEGDVKIMRVPKRETNLTMEWIDIKVDVSKVVKDWVSLARKR